MGIYKAPSEDEKKAIKKYTKLFEDIKVSDSALFAGKTYKEVTFTKKGIEKVRGNGEHYLYLDSNNNVVVDEKTIKRLGRIFFFMDAFLNDDSGSIIKALQSDEEVEKDKTDIELMDRGFETIQKKDKKYNIEPREVEKVKSILNKLIELRAKTNTRLEGFLQVVTTETEKQEYFDENVIEACMPAYKEVMTCNYEKVQLIAKGTSSYNYLRKAAERVKKSYSIRFSTYHGDPLMKISYMMKYFENLVRSYENIVNMSYNQYIKAIENSGKVNGDYKITKLRNKMK